MPRVVLLLVLMLALAACAGDETATKADQTQVADVATPTPKPGVRVVTEIEKAPTPTPVTPTPTPQLPTPTPLPVARLELLSHRTYTDAIGSLWVVGEARNTGDATASDIEVTLSLLGADGKVLAVSYATVHLAEVPAQGKMPFRAMFAQPPSGWRELKVDLTAAPYDPKAKSNWAPNLKVEATKLEAGVGAAGAVVSGQVRNGGNDPAMSVRVVAVIRAQDGKVADVVDGYAKLPELEPGATSPFSLQFFDAKQPGPYDVFVQGLLKPGSP